MNKFYIGISLLITSSLSFGELVEIKDENLMMVRGKSGVTLNAKVVLGPESNLIYTNTSGKRKGTSGALESYLIVDKIQGAVEVKGLKLDLVGDLNNSGKSALQWTLPEKIVATDLKTEGVYASTTKSVTPSTSTFLTSVQMNGTLLLPAETKISVFVAN